MNSDLQNKLQQFSADPPAGAWNKIASALEADESFAPRLYAYEEEPPLANWQKIEQALAAHPEKTKHIPWHQRISRPVRYVAAAGILAIVLVAITLTTERTEAGALQAEGTAVAPATNLPVTTGTHPSGNKNKAGQPLNANATTPGGHSNKSPGRPQAQQPTPAAGNGNFSTAPVHALHNDYVTYSDGNGKVMKVSRKMETYINCRDGDQPCKQRLQELRKKMAAKAMTTDFTGILEMLQQLQ